MTKGSVPRWAAAVRVSAVVKNIRLPQVFIGQIDVIIWHEQKKELRTSQLHQSSFVENDCHSAIHTIGIFASKSWGKGLT
jgi:hypothetical protein